MEIGLLVFVSLIGFLGLGLLWYRVVVPIADVVRGGLISYGPVSDTGAPVSSVFIPLPLDYVAYAQDDEPRYDGVGPAFERAEPASFVQAKQLPNGEGLSAEDNIRVDAAARLLAAGVQGEAAAIELLFDGVKRGGSRRYQAIRDGVRILAASKYGWKAPAVEPPAPAPRVIPVGRDGHAVEI